MAKKQDSSLSTVDSENQQKPGFQCNNAVVDPNIIWLPTTPPRPAPPLLTGEEVAMLLRLPNTKGSARTVRHYVATGELKGNRFGRKLKFRLKDVLAFINDRGV